MHVTHFDRLDELVAEAQTLPEPTGPTFTNQPSRECREAAEELLGEDAPWHQVAHLAHALEAE